MVMKAYTAVEELSGEYSGTVVYAKSNVEARRKAANELNDGEFGGLRVIREPQLDKYTRASIPMDVMINIGWWIDCSNCGVRVNADMYEDEEEYEGKTPVGTFFGVGFCCEECSKEWQARKEIEPILKYRMMQRLKGIAEQYVVDPVFDEDHSRCWIDWRGGEPKVNHANIEVTVPGAPRYSSLSVNYRLEADGKEKITLNLPHTDEGKRAFRKHATRALDILLGPA